MNFKYISEKLKQCALLLRWNKPSGRLILLIPAGWSLWLASDKPPSMSLILLIIAGGLSISGAGCIANDIWDRRIDREVMRTKDRPLAAKNLKPSIALVLLFLMLALGCLTVFLLPSESKSICLKLSIFALPIILIYPSAKRWCPYPQAFLSICWGFAVLIPWAARQPSLDGGLTLLACWVGTMLWTFGFDTVYAMADRDDDSMLGLNSSALSLGKNVVGVVGACYGASSFLIATGAYLSNIGWPFWPIWILATIGMLREAFLLKDRHIETTLQYGKHFKNQVWIGSLILLGLVIGR